MKFRDLTEGRKFAAWTRELKNVSGVYLIREKARDKYLEMSDILYIGESHTGQLGKTMLRHFQKWTGKTAGPTFPRSKIEVSIVRLPAARAVAIQNSLIEEYRPKLNIQANPDATDNENP